ncbi:MAG: hypothetical protein JSV03_04060, partial [Planctomycetota bacterium]
MLVRGDELFRTCVAISVVICFTNSYGATDSSSTISRVPPYGIVQFGIGARGDAELLEFLFRCHVNICEQAVQTPISTSVGWDRSVQFGNRVQKMLSQIKVVHQADVKAIAYLAYEPIYGDYKKRTRIFEFYDKYWDHYKKYLGP